MKRPAASCAPAIIATNPSSKRQESRSIAHSYGAARSLVPDFASQPEAELLEDSEQYYWCSRCIQLFSDEINGCKGGAVAPRTRLTEYSFIRGTVDPGKNC